MIAGLSFSPSFSLGDTAPESGKPFKWFSRVGDNEDPKLKLGENEKGRLQPAREKTNCKGCHDNEQRSDNPLVIESVGLTPSALSHVHDPDRSLELR